MPASSLFSDLDRPSAGLGDERALQLALELSMLGFSEPLSAATVVADAVVDPTSTVVSVAANAASDLSPFALGLVDEVRSKKSQNMTECVPVPSSEHVAEIVGRQGCKIKALRAKTNTYIKTPVRGEEPVFVVTGRKEDVAKAKREILSAAEHFSQIRASRKNNLAGAGGALSSGASTPPGPPANVPGHVTIQVRVPYRVVGLVVGPKGATIKRIQHQTHTYIVTPSRDKEPVFEVTGLPESVESARREIEAHIAMRTGGGAGAPALGGAGGGGLGPCLDDGGDLFTSLYKSGLGSILSYIGEPDAFAASSASSSGAFSSSSCSSSSSSSTSSGRDLGAIWSSSERDEGLGDSPSFDSSTALSSIWSYPTTTTTTTTTVPTRPSPANSASPVDSLLGCSSTSSSAATAKCLVCGEAKVTHALVPCGHNFFCMECANRVCDGSEAQCPVCSLPAIQAIRIYSPNP